MRATYRAARTGYSDRTPGLRDMDMFKREIALMATLLLLALPALGSATDIRIDVRFSGDEVSIIRAWYEGQRTPARGKKERQPLPPGIARNLARGKALPPGIAKQALPHELVNRLPPVRNGFERVVIDGKILLVDAATQVVHDVLVDVILD